MIVHARVLCKFNAYLLDKPATETEHALAVQVEKDTRPFVPRRTGHLVNSAQVEKNVITYRAPGVRSLYFGNKVVDPETGIVGFPIGNGEFRSRKGVKKVLDKTKKYTYTSGGAYWLRESRKANIEKWWLFAKKELRSNVGK